MHNYTIEDYKKAIKEKYNREIDSENFPSPSPANLRNLCWEIFEKNESSDDKDIFESFFGFPFDRSKKNHFKDYTDRFRPIGTFYKGKTDLADKTGANLAAVLVDFQTRPFKKFKEKGVIGYETSPGNTRFPEPFVVIDTEESNYNKGGNTKNSNWIQTGFLSPQTGQKAKNLIGNLKDKFLYIFRKKLKNTAIAVIVIFSLVAAVVYFAFFKNHCMQWSSDHYEIVDCTSGKEGNLNEIIPIDNDLLDFKKIKACDTTKCFLTNGEAFIWYGKTANGIDFFNDNGNGRHPETNKALRPVTNYIFNKYLKGKSCE